MTAFEDDSGLIIGDRYELAYSRRNGEWTLRDPKQRMRAWRDTTFLGIVEAATRGGLMYRYDLAGHDSGSFQPHSHSIEGVLLAVAGHPVEFSIPEHLREDYSKQELELIAQWQHVMLTGTASGQTPPIDPASMSFEDALRMISGEET